MAIDFKDISGSGIKQSTILRYRPFLEKYMTGNYTQRQITKQMGLVNRKSLTKLGLSLYGDNFKKVCKSQNDKNYDSMTFKPTIPEHINPDLGWFIGVLCGDGYTSKASKHIGLNVVDNDFAKQFSIVGKKLFSISPTIHKIPPEGKNRELICIHFNSKILYNWISDLGDFKTKTWRIPQAIFKADDKIKYSFLSGFIDSDGTVSKIEHKNGVSITTTNKEGCEDIILLLSSLKIKSFFNIHKYENPNHSIRYTIFIKKLDSVKKLASLDLACKSKQQALNKYLEYCNEKLGIIKKYNQVIELRKKFKWSALKISKIVGLHPRQVSAWMYENRKPRVMLVVN